MSDNETRRNEIVKELLQKPHEGGSYNFQHIEFLGETADYSEADHGTHWSDTKN